MDRELRLAWETCPDVSEQYLNSSPKLTAGRLGNYDPSLESFRRSLGQKPPLRGASLGYKHAKADRFVLRVSVREKIDFGRANAN